MEPVPCLAVRELERAPGAAPPHGARLWQCMFPWPSSADACPLTARYSSTFLTRQMCCLFRQGIMPNEFSHRVKVRLHTTPALWKAQHTYMCRRRCSVRLSYQSCTARRWLVSLQIAELNRHIDNMHQREEEYRRRIQVGRPLCHSYRQHLVAQLARLPCCRLFCGLQATRAHLASLEQPYTHVVKRARCR